MEQTVYQQLTDYLVAHQEDFYRLAFSYVKNRDAALDVVQESIVKALAKADTVRRPEYIKTWFYRILLNESMNHYRRTRRLVPLEDAAPEAADPPGRSGGAAGSLRRHRAAGAPGAGHHPPAVL